MFKAVVLAILGISWCNAQHGHHGASSYSTLALGHGGYGGYGGYGHGGYAGGYGGGFGHGYGGHGHYAIAAPVAVHAAPVAVHAVHAAPVAYAQAQHGHGHHVDYYAHPKYEFKYGVSDAHTGDHHQQHEVRDGDVVHGEYSLHEADGTIRIVKYTADHKNGFNAQVIKQGHAAHPTHVGHKAVVAAVPVHHAITYGGHGLGGHY